MSVRAKFQCVAKDANEDGSANSIVLHTVCDGSEENKAFFSATPLGQISLSTTNPAAAAAFEVGQQYYVDFTPAS